MDSKLITSYFAAVTKEQIRYNGEVIEPRPLVVSKLIFRGFTCPENCGACCTQPTAAQDGNTLNYLPQEKRALNGYSEEVIFNDKSFVVYSENMAPQTTSSVLPVLGTVFPCKHLTATARCGIYEDRSLACDLPLLQITRRKQYNQMSIRKFGRHHLYKQFDMKTRGTKCELLDITQASYDDTRRRLFRLWEWTKYFQLNTWLPEIMVWGCQVYPPTEDLKVGFAR